jgi:hypothetical protein
MTNKCKNVSIEHVVVEAYEIYERETELVLPCYIMMLDLYLKQVQF